jgi:hypothetical protein
MLLRPRCETHHMGHPIIGWWVNLGDFRQTIAPSLRMHHLSQKSRQTRDNVPHRDIRHFGPRQQTGLAPKELLRSDRAADVSVSRGGECSGLRSGRIAEATPSHWPTRPSSTADPPHGSVHRARLLIPSAPTSRCPTLTSLKITGKSSNEFIGQTR